MKKKARSHYQAANKTKEGWGGGKNSHAFIRKGGVAKEKKKKWSVWHWKGWGKEERPDNFQ